MLKTIFGSANLDIRGYYRITSSKEGNCYKLLHRLIWEKNYGEILRISEKRNKTGILHVFKAKNKHYKKGWCWRYQYYEDGKQKQIQSGDIQKLKEKVLAKGRDWIELDMED